MSPEFLRSFRISAHDKSIYDILIFSLVKFLISIRLVQMKEHDGPALRILVDGILQPADASMSGILVGLSSNTKTPVKQRGSSEILAQR